MKQGMGPLVVHTALREGFTQLRAAGVLSHTLAAELLLMHALGRDRAWLYAHPEESVSEEIAERFQALITRRAAGEPTQYLTGKQEFWGLELEVTPDVLIPRPETEHVIEVALDRLALREARAGRPQMTSGDGFLIADIGTGSGCLAIALAKELPKTNIYATDISQAALVVARRNAARHGVSERIRFVECNFLDNFDHAASHQSPSFHLIVSNPPYVGRRETETLPIEVRRHEPESALFGGEEGYEPYAGLISQAAQNLEPGGILVLELGHNSLPAVRPLLDVPTWTNVGVTNDLAGIPRVMAAEKAR
jgi:release factor glutamine methyltransferase